MQRADLLNSLSIALPVRTLASPAEPGSPATYSAHLGNWARGSIPVNQNILASDRGASDCLRPQRAEAERPRLRRFDGEKARREGALLLLVADPIGGSCRVAFVLLTLLLTPLGACGDDDSSPTLTQTPPSSSPTPTPEEPTPTPSTDSDGDGSPKREDCDDENALVYPGALERVADGVDEDCDGYEACYSDADGDSYRPSDGSLVASPDLLCDGEGEAAVEAPAKDCDDLRDDTYPGAAEVCDQWDNNCNEVEDEGLPIFAFYPDADGDGYGASVEPLYACGVPHYVTTDGDCRDDNSAVYPGAEELCDALDNNCDETVDEGFPRQLYYKDQDGDGYGVSNTSLEACAQPMGYSTLNDDCNDALSTSWPGAPEICNNLDDDCNTLPDDGLTTDADQDGHSTPSSCQGSRDDCYDSDPTLFPGLTVLENGLEMAFICQGSFLMGSPEGEVGRDANDETQQEVTLPHDFYISVSEITQGFFSTVMGYNPMSSACDYGCADDRAVGFISWHEAATFTNTLSSRAGLTPCYTCTGSGSSLNCALTESSPVDCEGYRLPTEAEWEFAARAGEDAAFPNGGELDLGDERNCQGELELNPEGVLDDMAFYCGNNGAQGSESYGIKPVRQLLPNRWGLYDVIGNQSEWCDDWYDFSYGAGWIQGTKIVRGGAWLDQPSYVRLASRGPATPASRYYAVGLRVVRTRY